MKVVKYITLLFLTISLSVANAQNRFDTEIAMIKGSIPELSIEQEALSTAVKVAAEAKGVEGLVLQNFRIQMANSEGNQLGYYLLADNVKGDQVFGMTLVNVNGYLYQSKNAKDMFICTGPRCPEGGCKAELSENGEWHCSPCPNRYELCPRIEIYDEKNSLF